MDESIGMDMKKCNPLKDMAKDRVELQEESKKKKTIQLTVT